MLEELFISRVRVKILDLFLKNLDKSYYVRQISRAVNTEINAVRRELNRLTKIKFLKRTSRGNRVFYEVRLDFALLPELLGLFYKQIGFGENIIAKQKELGKINFAVLTKYFVYKQVPDKNGVDTAIVGKVDLKLLQVLIDREQERLGREINYTVISQEDFEILKSRRDKFINQLLSDTCVFLLGEETAFRS